MNEQNQRDSIMSMARGAFEERVDYEMDKVIQNILDPNTKATAKRKITLTIELTPDDERRTIGVSVTAKSTLAATNPETAGSSPCRCAITSRSLRRTTGSSPPAPSVALSAGRQTRPAGSSHWSLTSEPPAQPAR